MILSDIAVKRPVLAVVLNLVIVVLGIGAAADLGIRELPDTDPPTVSINTNYPGAAASIVETRVTQVLEDAISGIEGVKSVSSATRDGRSSITIEFNLDRDIDNATNDVRDAVARVVDRLPEEADPPEIVKANSEGESVYWMGLASEIRDTTELTDYAERYLVDQFSSLTGVAQVRVAGGARYSMRIWLDRTSMAAQGITAGDIEAALRSQNVELPAGRVESTEREFTVRIARRFKDAEDFENLVLAEAADGHLVRLREVARVEVGPESDRFLFRRNGVNQVGIGVVRQAKSNTLEVCRLARERREEVRATLPPDMELYQSTDDSIYIEAAISEVRSTLLVTAGVVALVIFLFLGSGFATLVPIATVPVSLIGTFFILSLLGFTINVLTLLALVLAIGLVVDDAIVVLENVTRRIREGEAPIRAAYLGARQVGFAVVATTVVLVAVFVPIGFIEGNTGRLFREFALALAGAVCLSTFVALTLSPVMIVFLLRDSKPSLLARGVDAAFRPLQRFYDYLLGGLQAQPLAALLIVGALGASIAGLIGSLSEEYAPDEDRGNLRVSIRGPEGASFEQATQMADRFETEMMSYINNGEAQRILLRVPGGFGSPGAANTGWGTVLLKTWDQRERTTTEVQRELNAKFSGIPGFRATASARSSLNRGGGSEVSFVLTGPTFEDLVRWRNVVLDKARENPGLTAVDSDYRETKPQIQVVIDDTRAGDLGVSSREIGATLETMMGERRVTTWVERGEEYDVIVEAEDNDKRSPADLEQIYVRSSTSEDLVPLANLVKIDEFADSATLNRYDRNRAITISAQLAGDYSLGEALQFLRDVVRDELKNEPGIAYKGQSRDFVDTSDAIAWAFLASLLLVYLALAAQFESFLQPLVILTTVPLALFGGLVGLHLTDGTLNVFSKIALVILIGLATKNGILVVEFANQLRDQGRSVRDAAREAAVLRLRPILMTGLSTALGSLPLVLATGAGAESRRAIGIVVLSGVTIATFTTLLVVPTAYGLLARFSGTPLSRARELKSSLGDGADRLGEPWEAGNQPSQAGSHAPGSALEPDLRQPAGA